MAKQKKRKAGNDAQQKLQTAKSRNEFKRRLKELCALMGDEAKYKLLERDIEVMFKIRPRAIRVVAIDKRVSKKFIAFIRQHIDYYMKRKKVPMYEGGPEVSYKDYHQLVEPLRTYLNVREEDGHAIAKAFAPVLKVAEVIKEDVVVETASRIEMLGITESDFTECFFHVTFDIGHSDKGGSPRENLYVEVRSESPTWKQIKVGSGKRTAARVGFSFPRSIEWLKIKPSQLGIRRPGDNQAMDVYILKHAAQRLYERIGGVYRDLMNMDVILSLHDIKAFPTGGGNYLIEHRVSKVKAGYYVATITDGVLLIRTFLLITHKGTPEGKKLAELTGLGKWDHKYLQFDTLPALANSDILLNEQTRTLFCEAGCEGLVAICEKMRNKPGIYKISDKQNKVADKLLQYIKSGKEEISDYWTDEPEEIEELPEVADDDDDDEA